MRYSTSGARRAGAARAPWRRLSAQGIPLALSLLLAACGGNGNDGAEPGPTGQGGMSGSSRMVAAETALTPVNVSASSSERGDLGGAAAIDHNDKTRWGSGFNDGESLTLDFGKSEVISRVLFLVDKFVRPKLIGHRVNLPFLAVLFGLLGGVSTLGVLGLFVGPFMMAVLFWWLRGGEMSATPENAAAVADQHAA